MEWRNTQRTRLGLRFLRLVARRGFAALERPPMMQKRSLIRLSLVVASLALIAPASSWAQSADVAVRAYGAVGLARGETARLVATNLLLPDFVPPNPCRVQLGFVDAAGALWSGRSGPPVSRTADLLPGESVALTLRSDDVFASATGLRSTVRAVMSNPGPPDLPPDPCAGLARTLEIFDTESGWTQVAYSDPGPLKEVQLDDVAFALQARFGFIGLARGLVARLNASRVGLASTRSTEVSPSPCRVTLEFRNRDGEVFTTRDGAAVQARVDLLPGQTASLELSSADVITGNRIADVVNPVLSNPGPPDAPPNPCADVIGTVEIYDGLAGRIQSVWSTPGPPDISMPASRLD